MVNLAKTTALFVVCIFITSLCILPSSSAASSDGDSWVSKAPMQVARGGLGVAVVDGKIYAIGGYPGIGQTLTTNEEYDPKTDTWTFKASSPVPLAFFGITVYQNRIYCIDSSNGVTAVYTPSTDKWETKASLPNPREGITAVTVGGKIYVVGGKSELMDVYDPLKNAWTTGANVPFAPDLNWGWSCASFVLNNEIHIIGALPPGTHQIYNPLNDSWRSGTSISSGFKYVYFATAGVTTEDSLKRVYVFGGDRRWWDNGEIYFPTQVYVPENSTWTQGISMPTGRLEAGVTVVDDLIYAIGGFVPWMGSNWDPSTANEQYIPFGYDTSNSAAYLPKITFYSVSNQTYNSRSVPLNFTVDKPVSWLGYSLDGHDNITITGNTTLSGLSVGLHNITLYAKDFFGNTAVSDTIPFTVATESFPLATVVIGVSAFLVAALAIGVFCLLKRNKRVSLGG